MDPYHLVISENEFQHHSSTTIQISNLELSSSETEATTAVAPTSEVGMQQVEDEEEGLFLTWEDLWISVPNGKHGSKAILQGLTGYAEPGQLLAIMGPSGCGKSTLLDTLAGRSGSSTRQSGHVLINGQKQALAYGTSAYVTQDDTLVATLTVGEAVYYSAQLQLPDTMTSSEKKDVADRAIMEMGLQDAKDTRIGGWGVKGLSGGQKRRVSICIEILTRPKLLFLDEPTSGLDSAASYYVMKRIAAHRQQDRRTIIASIHQPSTEVFQLFDNLCLLSSGRTVYFGSANAATEFFSVNGFPCPSLQNPSDHFLRTINKDFDEDVEAGTSGKKPTEKAIEVLVQSYISSDTRQQVRALVAKLCESEAEALEEKRGHASFGNQCAILTRRSFVNMYRDLGYYWLRLLVYVALGVGLGTIFYNVGSSSNSVQARGSMLMFVATFLTFMAIGGFPSFVEEMKVFHRERLNGHYGCSAFVIGNTVSSLPFLLLISLIPGLITFYLVELHRRFDHFVYYVMVLLTCMILVESLMMVVAAIVPNFLMGIITGAGIQGLMILCGGFFRLPDDLPGPVWKYPLYYVAFHKYAYQGLYKNEFEGRSFPSNDAGVPPVDGKAILKENWQLELGYSKWVDLSILLGMFVVYRLLFLIIIKTIEKAKPLMKRTFSRAPNQAKQVIVDPSATPKLA